MSRQKIFSFNFINTQLDQLKSGKGIENYFNDKFAYNESAVLESPAIKAPKPADFVLPNDKGNYEYENSLKIYEAYKNLNPTQASDVRFWTYLAHVDYWVYMKKRRKVEAQPKEKLGEYIIQHWFINPLSASNLLRHDIALLWWGAYLTYDENRDNPYELTKELFSMLDYTRFLLPSTQGRNREFIHAFLEFIIQNDNLFKQYKEGRVRYLMRVINRVGGYKVFPSLPKKEMIDIFTKYKNNIALVKGRN